MNECEIRNLYTKSIYTNFQTYTQCHHNKIHNQCVLPIVYDKYVLPIVYDK